MKKIKIKDEFEIDVKRFKLPIKIEQDCPSCNSKCEVDLNSKSLSYPTVNKIERLSFYCGDCSQEFEIDTVLKISLHIDSKIHIL